MRDQTGDLIFQKGKGLVRFFQIIIAAHERKIRCYNPLITESIYLTGVCRYGALCLRVASRE